VYSSDGCVGDFVIPTFTCPFPVTRIGTLGDGGKWVCGFERVVNQPNCVVYSFGQYYIGRGVWFIDDFPLSGVERESSFEAEILSATDSCRIYGKSKQDYSTCVSLMNTRLRLLRQGVGTSAQVQPRLPRQNRIPPLQTRWFRYPRHNTAHAHPIWPYGDER
jgi:hypothetical protein